MTIDLSDFEAGARYRGDYSDDLAALQERLGADPRRPDRS